jgi:hypothetical protein
VRWVRRRNLLRRLPFANQPEDAGVVRANRESRKSISLRAAMDARRSSHLLSPSAIDRCRRKFLRIFPGGFRDETYLAWERDYKWEAHREWRDQLGRAKFRALLQDGKFAEIAGRAVKIESSRSLLFSFEKMALRDAVKMTGGAEKFASGLYEFLHGAGSMETRFNHWCGAVAALPRRQTRVLTWPLVTVFGFIAQPERHIFLKPNTTKEAARKCGFDFHYVSRPNWETYGNYLEFAAETRRAIAALRPRDMVDIQSFLWVQGSDEYR